MLAKIFLKWTLLVWLNAAFSFYIALEEFRELADRLGIICAVFTCAIIYTAIDWHLSKINAVELQKSLLIAVLIKACTQFWPMLELSIGMLSMLFINFISFEHTLPFLTPYLVTLTDAGLLSIVMALVMLPVRLVIKKVTQKQNC